MILQLLQCSLGTTWEERFYMWLLNMVHKSLFISVSCKTINSKVSLDICSSLLCGHYTFFSPFGHVWYESSHAIDGAGKDVCETALQPIL